MYKNRAGVNFINIIVTNFSYECCFGSFFYVHVTRKKAAETTFVWKICTNNVDEIDGWSLSPLSKMKWNDVS